MSVFIARQPIFDQTQNVFAYELLYRSGVQNRYDHTDGDHATTAVLDNSFFSIGIDTITGGKLAFVNFTGNLLKTDLPTIFPSDQIAIEILEDVPASNEIVARCQRYKDNGYLLVMDDFIYKPELRPLTELVDIIKVDFQSTAGAERLAIMEKVGVNSIKYLAERVETREQFSEAVAGGYTYFQGYFFAQPEILKGQEIPSYKLNYLRVLQQVNGPDLNFDALENIFKQDVSLSYKLLRYINSAYFGLPQEIKSIRHALKMIGLREAKKWLSLIALSSMGKGKSEELVRISLQRANMCELVAPLFKLQEAKDELFLMGLFSLLDGFLDVSMEDALSQLPLPDNIKAALLGEPGSFQTVLKVITAYERGDWDRVFQQLISFDSVAIELPDLFFQTLERCYQLYPG